MNNFNYKNLTPFKWFVLENFPFIEADFDALTEWQLFCKLGKEINKIINSTNTLGTQVQTLTDYVSNYFDNLDIQEEVNKKINDMVESGELQEIITSYLQLQGILAYNTVNEMKQATNIINGSFCKTYGKNTLNDGLGRFYKVRQILNTDVIDEINIISLNNQNLVAVLMKEQYNGNFVFDTVSDLKNSNNLIAGNTAETLGFYNINDGGKATYKIVDNINENIDEATIIELNNNLYAILIYDNSYINVKQFGAYGDNEHIENEIFENILEKSVNGTIIFIPNGIYKFNSPLNIDKIITIEGTSNSVNIGSQLVFDNCSGLIYRNSYINVKNVDIKGINKPSEDTIDIENNIYGTIGISCIYDDNFTSGGCTTNFINIHGFNTGIALYSNRTSDKWAGCYREFIKTYLTYNDIGYLIKDGATYNSIIQGLVNNNSLHGIYADTSVYYQEIEVIDCSIEGNGINTGFTDNEFKQAGIYSGNKTRIKFTNSYLENEVVVVENNGFISLINCYIHSNVPMFGTGTILSEGSHASFSKQIGIGLDIASRSTNVGLTIANLYGKSPAVSIKSTATQGENHIAFPDLFNVTIPIKDVEHIKFEFDAKVLAGLENVDFGLHPYLQLVGFGSSNVDGINVELNYCPKNLKLKLNEWGHYTIFWKPRKSASYLKDIEQLIYRITAQLYFSNKVSDLKSDFSITNLNMELANPSITVYSNTNTTYNNDILYLKG